MLGIEKEIEWNSWGNSVMCRYLLQICEGRVDLDAFSNLFGVLIREIFPRKAE